MEEVFGYANEYFTLVILLACLAVMYVPLSFYLYTLQKTFEEVDVENRRMHPHLVWLQLIPFFGYIWQFIVVVKIADSLRIQFYKSNIRLEEFQPGQSLGIATSVLFCVSIVPVLGIFTFIGAVVCWILYWVKINGYRNQLKQHNLFEMGNSLIEY